MKIIKLYKNKEAFVDDEDYEWLNQYKWFADAQGYIVRHEVVAKYVNGKIKRKVYFMHREIMRTPKGMDTDHINHEKNDNQKQNLRICKHAQNQQNMSIKKHRQYKGAFKSDKKGFAARSYIRINGVNKFIGYFKNPRHAAMAYDIWAKEIYGEYALTNFASCV